MLAFVKIDFVVVSRFCSCFNGPVSFFSKTLTPDRATFVTGLLKGFVQCFTEFIDLTSPSVLFEPAYPRI